MFYDYSLHVHKIVVHCFRVLVVQFIFLRDFLRVHMSSSGSVEASVFQMRCG